MSLSRTAFARLIALAALCTAPATALLAQETSDYHVALSDDFYIGVGAFLSKNSISLAVNGTDLSEEFDFDESVAADQDDTVFAGEFVWRFGQKWSVSAQYFKTDANGEAVLTEDIEWGDVIFGAGSNVSGGAELEVIRVFLGRKFWSGPQYEFGAGLGLHWLEVGAFLEGEAIINGETTGRRRESVSAGAPLPNLGAWYRYSPSRRWLLSARADWLDASFEEYSGSLWNAAVGVDFQFTRHFGIGLSYQAFSLDVDVDNSNWRGAVDYSADGPFLALTASW